MKILFVVGFYPTKYSDWWGSFFHNYAKGLVRRGHEVTILRVAPQNRQEAKERKRWFIRDTEWRDGVRIEIFFFPKVPKLDGITRWLLKGFQKKVYREIYPDKAPDIAHLHFGEMETSLMASQWLPQLQIPYVVTEHATSFQYDQISARTVAIARRVYEGANGISVVGHRLLNRLESLYPFIFRLIPNGIDSKLFAYDERPLKARIDFLDVGSLMAKKNQTTLVRCFAQAFGDREDVFLTIAGEGPERQKIQDEIERRHLEKRIRLTGAVSNLEVRELMKQADFFVLPSLVETFGVAALEALSCGIPVLATRSGGPEDFIRPGVDGIVVDKSESDIIEGLRALLAGTWDRKKISVEAHERFDVEKVAQQLESLYSDALKEGVTL
ncbi:MAG: glycosyltransferase [Spirochaetales bacterium]|nr:glycosyltransferase [Spirochaetales bacterium]